MCPATVIGAVAPGQRGRRVDRRDPLVGAEEQLLEAVAGVLQWAARLSVHDEVGLLDERLGAAAHLAGDLPHDREVGHALGRDDARLGGAGHHGGEFADVGLVRVVDVVGVGARHDEVDAVERVAQVGRARHVVETGQAALAGLEVVDVHEVGTGAEVAAPAAEAHGRLAVAVEDRHDGRGRRAGALDERTRQAHEIVAYNLGAGAAQQLERLALVHAHADRGDDLEGCLVDRALVVVAEKADLKSKAARSVCHGRSVVRRVCRSGAGGEVRCFPPGRKAPRCRDEVDRKTMDQGGRITDGRSSETDEGLQRPALAARRAYADRAAHHRAHAGGDAHGDSLPPLGRGSLAARRRVVVRSARRPRLAPCGTPPTFPPSQRHVARPSRRTYHPLQTTLVRCISREADLPKTRQGPGEPAPRCREEESRPRCPHKQQGPARVSPVRLHASGRSTDSRPP